MWENTICLSDMMRVGHDLQYVGEVEMGRNARDEKHFNLSEVTLGCVLILSDIDDWLVGDKFPEHYIHLSISSENGSDEYVLLMMAVTGRMREREKDKPHGIIHLCLT